MNDLLNKLSSYNLFNNLLPGAVFVYGLGKISGHDLMPPGVVLGLVVCYVVGLIIGRVGSLTVQPILMRMGVVRFGSYPIFLKASRTDTKLETLLEVSNMYRSLCTTALLLLTSKAVLMALDRSSLLRLIAVPSLCAALVLLFGVAFGKQSKYITDRVEADVAGAESAVPEVSK